MAMQGVRKVFFVGPDRNDPTCKVATMELTCGCKVTQSIKGSWLRELSEAGYVVDGEVACPKGHELPASLKTKSTLIDRALGRRR
ncbi:MAG: hypothetical protein H6712_10575 [Myxococcales bacterium]|nr:hypothetical protein [Myxococcales bacterium]MCB9714293.1 hypothetical protein [Myxococcales bacterium]